ncbi:MAG: protein phosphatase CheZ [Bdellovibrionales bacterium]|nr:protein phosphatase CheZ [Bdellovibrionales bacterium]
MSECDKPKDTERALDEFLDFLGKGDLSALEGSLTGLGVEETSLIFQKTCNMAVELHQSLMNFKNSLCNTNVTMSSTTIPDAADKLENVMKMTFEAANTTIDALEHQTQLLEDSKQSLEESISRIENDGRLCAETRGELVELLNGSKEKIDLSLESNFKVITAQEYQDLTGQALQKVIKLVQELEGGLVGIVKLFGIEFNGCQTSEPETVVIESETKISQDSVDELLKGFD